MSSSIDDEAYALATRHHRSGRLAEAAVLYREIIERQPNHSNALHLLGVLAHQGGKNEEAIELIGRAIAVNPGEADYHNNLGVVLHAQKRLEEAAAAYLRALLIRPDSAEIYVSLGNSLKSLGQLGEARAAFEKAILRQANLAAAHSGLGDVLTRLGFLWEAEAACRRAVALQDGYAAAHHNLGSALLQSGKLAEAEAAYQRALELDSRLAEAHSNMGVLRLIQERPEDAVEELRKSLAIRPGDADTYNNLGNPLKDMGRLTEALAAFRRAMELEPGDARYHSNYLYAMQFHPDYDDAAILRESLQWDERHGRPLREFLGPHENDRDPGRRLRIGYVSPDFRAHVAGFFILPLLRAHDREKFAIHCYSGTRVPDDLTRLMRGHSDVWCEAHSLTDAELAKKIRADEVDILVDLTMHMAGGRLPVFARSPAPVQATWLAYPGTTGLSAMDYRISDPYLDPPGGASEKCYAEKTVRLPETFWCFDPRAIPFDGHAEPGPLPALANGHITFGCLNNFCKVNAGVLELWAQVMRNVPGSRLILLAGRGAHRGWAVDVLAKAGIQPGRIEFQAPVGRGDYLRAYRRIDVMLDTFPYNGHTTSLDSLWMGVPVVTLKGTRVVGRAGWSQLNNVGLGELAAEDAAEFVALAARLAGDLARLAELRRTLRGRVEASPLMDARRFAGNMETLYRAMWRDWCGGG